MYFFLLAYILVKREALIVLRSFKNGSITKFSSQSLKKVSARSVYRRCNLLLDTCTHCGPIFSCSLTYIFGKREASIVLRSCKNGCYSSGAVNGYRVSKNNLMLFSPTGLYTRFTEHYKTEAVDSQLPDLVDYDEYDAKVFRNPTGHSILQGYPPRGSGFRRIRSALEMQRMAKSVSKDELLSYRMSSPSKGMSSYEDLEISSSSSSMLIVSDVFLSLVTMHFIN